MDPRSSAGEYIVSISHGGGLAEQRANFVHIRRVAICHGVSWGVPGERVAGAERRVEGVRVISREQNEDEMASYT